MPSMDYAHTRWIIHKFVEHVDELVNMYLYELQDGNFGCFTQPPTPFPQTL